MESSLPVLATASAPPAPDPSPLPPAVEEEVEERPPPPPMKMKRAAYAMYRVCRGMGLAGDDVLVIAYGGIHALLYVVHSLQFDSLWAAPERARFWRPIQTVVVCACVAANALFFGLLVRNYMGVDGVKQQPAEAAELLPPPPPEMDMC